MDDTQIEIQAGPVLEAKFAPHDDGVIAGYLARYREVDGHGEVFEAGAFAKSLVEIASSGLRIPLLWAHRQDEPIGSWDSLRETPEGITGRATINKGTHRGREALALVRKGDLSGLSVGFTTPPNGRRGNLILEAYLKEASLVSIPSANKARVITLKDFGSLKDLAEHLQGGGLSRRDAELIARKAWPAVNGEPPEQDLALKSLAARIEAATLELKSLKRN